MTRSTRRPAPRLPLVADAHFVLRTPLLAIEEFVGLAAPQREQVRARLAELVAKPELREALFLASPSLEASIPAWLHAPESAGGQATERALIRYVARMAGRATPFATCSGVSLGRLGEVTQLELEARQAHARRTRLDHEWLIALADELATDPELRARLHYRPNATLHHSGEQLRYVEVRHRGGTRVRELARVAASAVIVATLDDARVSRTLDELAAALSEREGDVSLADARVFVEALVDAQLLVAELEPALTGDDASTTMRSILARAGGRCGSLAARLSEVEAELAAIDRDGLGHPAARYRDLAATLAREFPGSPPQLGRMVQVELLPTTRALELGPAIVDELARAAMLLAELRPAMSESHPLRRFVRAFQARHGEREVALLDVLDEDLGLGFGPRVGCPTPLLSELGLGPDLDRSSEPDSVPDALARRVSRVLRSGGRELVLEDPELAQLRAREPAILPDALAVVAKLVGTPEALARGDFQLVISGAGGPSGARLLARHCHASPELQQLVSAHVAREQALRPEPIHAEIVHLDHARDGNIVARPVLREYEIVIDARSGAARDRQIGLDDLFVSVVGERVVLRSHRLAREVVPRLSAAHEYRRASQPIYRFLAALQDQDGSAQLGWSWGALEACEFTPRVRHGRTILARATWRLRISELGELADALAELDAATTGEQRNAGYERLTSAMQSLRHAQDMPRFVVIAERDLELPVDFENPIALESAARLLAAREQIVIREMLPAPDQLPVISPAGHHAHELIVTFTRDPELPSKIARPATRARPSALVRSFAPGSEWLFAKLYAGPGLGDELLRELVAPLRGWALDTGVVDRWFFVRYDDPEHHLRVRFHGAPARLVGELLPALERAVGPWLASGRIHRLAIDTYEPEVDRYGGPSAVAAIEAIWWHDSEAALALLDTLSGDESEQRRWQLALRGMTLLLDELVPAAATRAALIMRARDGLRREFRVQSRTTTAIGTRYRRERHALAALALASRDEGVAVLEQRTRALAPHIAHLRELARAGQLREPIDAFAWSIGHMHVNRMIAEHPRAHELVFYDFLAREQDMRRARGLA